MNTWHIMNFFNLINSTNLVMLTTKTLPWLNGPSDPSHLQVPEILHYGGPSSDPRHQVGFQGCMGYPNHRLITDKEPLIYIGCRILMYRSSFLAVIILSVTPPNLDLADFFKSRIINVLHVEFLDMGSKLLRIGRRWFHPRSSLPGFNSDWYNDH